MFYNNFIRKAFISLMVLCGFNQTISPMVQTMQTFWPQSLLTTLHDNKTSLIAGIGTFTTGLLGYTAYRFWQTNKTLSKQIKIKNAKLYDLMNTIEKERIKKEHLIENCTTSQLSNEKLSCTIEDLIKTQRTNSQSLQELAMQQSINYELLQQKNDKVQKLKKRLLNQKSIQKSDSLTKIIQEAIKGSHNYRSIPFIQNLNHEQNFKDLENQFTHFPSLHNNPEIIFENNTDLKGKEKENSALSMTNSFEVGFGEPITAQAPLYQFYRFDPQTITYSKKIDDKSPIVLLSIHGTFVKSQDEEVTEEIVKFAKQLARDQRRDVIILPYCWSGFLGESARVEAGKVLADHINKNCNEEQEIWAITHSHGGNVLFHAAQHLKRPIDYAITIAPPIPDTLPKEQVTTTSRVVPNSKIDLKIRNLFNIYSTGDITQSLGSNYSSTWLPLIYGNYERRIPFLINGECKVWNIRAQDQGCELNHLNIIAPTIANLHKLLPIIKVHYAHIHDLDANFSKLWELPQVVVRNWVRSIGFGPAELQHAFEFSDNASLQFE